MLNEAKKSACSCDACTCIECENCQCNSDCHCQTNQSDSCCNEDKEH